MRATTRYTIKKFIHATFNRRAQAKAARARLEAIRHHNGEPISASDRVIGIRDDGVQDTSPMSVRWGF